MTSIASVTAGSAGSARPDLAASGAARRFQTALSGLGQTERLWAAQAPAGNAGNAAEDARALQYAYLAGPQGAPDGSHYGGGQEHYDAVATARHERLPEPAPPAPIGDYELVHPDDLAAGVREDHDGEGLPDALDLDGDASVYLNRQTEQYVLSLRGRRHERCEAPG